MVHMAIRWNSSLKGKELGHFKIWAPLLHGGRMGGKTKGRKDEEAVFKSKTEPPKKRDEVLSVNRSKNKSKTCNQSVFVVVSSGG